MEVNRGARTLNEDIVASDHSTASAPPVHRGVMMEGFGIDFNLEEMKNCVCGGAGDLKEVIKQVI